MNMVRAGVVEHPAEWEFCGYKEIQNPRKRKGIIDFDRLIDLLGFKRGSLQMGNQCTGD